jgi:beta-N-acetylhexosaminidase
MRNIFFLSVGAAFLVFSGFLFVQESLDNQLEEKNLAVTLSAPFLNKSAEAWADSVLTTLTLDEKIGQLFMVAAYSNKDSAHQASIESLITEQHIGGLIFFQGAPYKQAVLTNNYQAKAKVPLMISIDGEWGLAMRLDSTHKFPKQMTLGALSNDSLIYEMGAEMAEHCKRLGIHVNLAPVADVNNNKLNPVINYRSFGEDKYNVTRKSIAYMNGMQNNGIMANAKHFPGHGDTDSDSHKTLPIITHNRQRLDSIELYPFRNMIDQGLGSMMIAHLYIPSLDSIPNRASTLSKKIVTDLLQDELNFKGLIFTDALNMRGVSAFFDPGKLDVEALLAGNDVLLFSEDVPTAVIEIKKALADKLITEKEITAKCKKILMAKKWTNVDGNNKVNLENLTDELNPIKAKYLNQKLYEQSITVIKNDKEILPLRNLGKRKIASLCLGQVSTKQTSFTERADMYCALEAFNFDAKLDQKMRDKVTDSLKDYNTILISIHDMSQRPYQNFGFFKESIALVKQLAADSTKDVILTILGNPYSLDKLGSLDNLKGVVVAYEERKMTEQIAASIIFGGISSKGKLPVSINEQYPVGTGIETAAPTRFKYTMPEELGITDKDLKGIEAIVNEGLKDGVFPGCQVLVAKDGKVFYHKGFGSHTYDKDSRKVETTDIYDLASVTKIASSTAALMKLQSEGKLNVDSTLNTYLKSMVDTSAYRDIKLKEMLAHQAGFAAWIPFYIRTLHKGQPKIELYSIKQSDYFSERVAENLYVTPGVRDSIFKRILSTSVSDVKKYKYSDLGYYFVNEMIYRITKQKQDEYVNDNFYAPLGLDNIGYKPREKWDINRIPPTEDDQSFRHQLIQGDVHDQGAAMLGGVCGHAGLFSNANDLAVMMQTFMNYGAYGGERYYSEETGKYFTSSPYYSINRNRRGIGFDKPVRAGGSGPTCSKCASELSFGHSGFTGTLTWADPSNGMVFVFLSNRVYPDAENRKIISSSTRTRIMQIIYDALKKADSKS